MITFDIHNGVRETLNSYTTYVIPLMNGSELEIQKRENLNYFPLDELTFKDAPNYYEVSYEELEKYVKEFYFQVLPKLDPNEIYNKLIGTCLTSDERTDSFAKRHIFCAWLKIYTDIDTNEMGTGANGKLIKLDVPEFIYSILEKVIRESINDMKGFTSLKALYVYEQSERLEANLKFVTDKDEYTEYTYMINLLKNDAYRIEYEYKNKNKNNGYSKKYPKLKG